MKKLDRYIISTFFGPFIFIFSILFFIFTVQLAWSKLAEIAGKGISTVVLSEMILLLGLQFVPLIIPLTILLSAIMCFGGLGERYELTAMRSSGISLTRIMTPLFFITIGLAFVVFAFTDSMIPIAEKKAVNLLNNVLKSSPTLSLKEGRFSNLIGFEIKVNKISGDDGDKLEDIYVHSINGPYDDQQTILAKKGRIHGLEGQSFLVLELYDGSYYIDQKKNKTFDERNKQPFMSARFDTLIQYIDVAKFLKKNLDDDEINDNYKFYNTRELYLKIDTLNKENKVFFTNLRFQNRRRIGLADDEVDEVIGINDYTQEMVFDASNNAVKDTTDINKAEFAGKTTHPDIIIKKKEKEKTITWVASLDTIKRKNEIIELSLNQIESDLIMLENNEYEIKYRRTESAKFKFKSQENLALPLTCIIFFLIGAPLGAIIRKGGIGTPVVVAIGVFVIYFLIYSTSRNMAKSGALEPNIAAWLANFFLLPLGLLFTYKSLNDSELFNIENYLNPIQNFVRKFIPKENKEHQRYK